MAATEHEPWELGGWAQLLAGRCPDAPHLAVITEAAVLPPWGSSVWTRTLSPLSPWHWGLSGVPGHLAAVRRLADFGAFVSEASGFLLGRTGPCLFSGAFPAGTLSLARRLALRGSAISPESCQQGLAPLGPWGSATGHAGLQSCPSGTSGSGGQAGQQVLPSHFPRTALL